MLRTGVFDSFRREKGTTHRGTGWRPEKAGGNRVAVTNRTENNVWNVWTQLLVA